ncbi:MAG TPA: NADH-quinone oxidoreductase subunit J [Verrucomicrobiae bacterium]|nr:NADH-quinone oxidoreductase subunit J [Verrucomicrobiae bacterium]
MNPFPASSLIANGIFLVCVATMSAGALLAVLSARLIRSVCGLAICSFGLAGLYYFLNSPFLALMEILIYVGAVCVTIIFAIMLAEADEPPAGATSGSAFVWGGVGLVAAVAIFYALGWVGTHATWTSIPAVANDGSIKAIGRALLTTYSLAFELISLAILVAIVGALAIAKPGRTQP